VPTKSKKPGSIATKLTDASKPMEIRLQLLRQVIGVGDEMADPILAEVLEAAGAARGEEQFHEKNRELSELIAQLQAGPLRHATFDQMLAGEGNELRARVILLDGGISCPTVADEKMIPALQRGDTVLLDHSGGVLLFHETDDEPLGEEATLERCIGGGRVEVKVGELGSAIYRIGARLQAQLDAAEVDAGCKLIVCPRRQIAFEAVPPEEGLSHYRYLCQDPVPNVVVARDIGAPPAFIGRLSRHVARELKRPELGQRFLIRRSKTQFLSGIAGTGKSHGILGLWNNLYAIMADMTGVPVDELPQRVMKLRTSEVLSKWVGGSDKRIARFFEEMEELAGETFEAPDGTKHELPLLVICEEIDALARERGEDGVHDRIMSELLAGLDPARPVYKERLIIVVCTTNMPELVDGAFLRRAGGSVERIGHLKRREFGAVLAKHIGPRPLEWADGEGQSEARRRIVDDLAVWLYGQNAEDDGQVEINYVGQANASIIYRRDFVTAGLIDRAVQEACEEAVEEAWLGDDDRGFDTAQLSRAIDRQVSNIAGLLTAGNAARYLALPDGMRVATVRRIAQPVVLPFELERAS
jgi:hypothetical protein